MCVCVCVCVSTCLIAHAQEPSLAQASATHQQQGVVDDGAEAVGMLHKLALRLPLKLERADHHLHIVDTEFLRASLAPQSLHLRDGLVQRHP